MSIDEELSTACRNSTLGQGYCFGTLFSGCTPKSSRQFNFPNFEPCRGWSRKSELGGPPRSEGNFPARADMCGLHLKGIFIKPPNFGNECGAFCPDSWGTLMKMRAFLPRFRGHLVQNMGHLARAGGAMAPLAPPLDQPLQIMQLVTSVHASVNPSVRPSVHQWCRHIIVCWSAFN